MSLILTTILGHRMSKNMKKIIFLSILILLITPLKSHAETIVDGDLIRATNDFDVYIVKLIGAKKFKRLILNPEIFDQYGHLKWENIKNVSQAIVDSYTASDLVRAVGDTKVYKLYPNGDVGEKRWIKTADYFLDLGYDWDAIYTINNFERDFYTAGLDLEAAEAPQQPTVPQEPTTPSRDPITINVPADYSTITAALNAAIDGDTISVKAGTYKENITINKSVKLIGEAVGSTMIDGQGNNNAITIAEGTNILIQKLTIKSQNKYAIYCRGENAVSSTFKNNIIKDSGWGIVAEDNCQLTILNNLVYNNKNSANTDGAGILIKNNYSYGITSEIRNNTIDDNYHGIWSENANVKLMNSIVSSNIGGKGMVDSTGVYHVGQGTFSSTYSDVWGNGWDYKGDASVGDGTLINDPRFVDAYNQDYRLRTGTSGDVSPCVDKGHPDSIYYDGNRVGVTFGDNLQRNDMGAYGGPDNFYW